MHLDFIRGEEIERQQGTLSATLYNRIHVVFAQSDSETLFVPIRSMQYLAIIDKEEIIFVDGQRPRAIEISWRDFQTGQRDNLQSPVAFTCIYYRDKNNEFMNRLHSEFLKALNVMSGRSHKADATVINIKKD